MIKKQKKTIKEGIKKLLDNYKYDIVKYPEGTAFYATTDEDIEPFIKLIYLTLQRFIEETRVEIDFEVMWKEFRKRFGDDACNRYQGYEVNELIKSILKDIDKRQTKWLKENL